MTEADRLLRQYIDRLQTGELPDPEEFLGQLEGSERERLAASIQTYWATAPRREWNPDEYEGSVAERAVAQLAESWSDASGELPTTLVELRNERKLRRRVLVERLAETLGLSGAGQEEKVARYYHELEQGLLPAQNVSSKVFNALAALLGTSADVLRRAGAAVTPASGEEPGVLYARVGKPDPAHVEGVASDAGADEAERTDDWDEVDRLFRGGG